MQLSRARLGALLNTITGSGVAVIGDLALDAYWHIDMTQADLSRETPHFNRPVTGESYSPGAGGNVARNAAVLGLGSVYAVGVLGQDWRGALLRERLEAHGVEVHGLTVEGRMTSTYAKPILHGYESVQEAPRIDFSSPDPIDDAQSAELLGALDDCLSKVGAVIVCQQFPVSAITPAVRDGLVSRAVDHMILVDSRGEIGAFSGCILKPNQQEAAEAVGPGAPEITAAKLIKGGARMVYLTLGAEGALLHNGTQTQHLPGVPVTGPIDIVGAGDAFMAAAAGALAAGATPAEAGTLGNMAAAISVQKIGETGSASPEELLALYDEVYA
jgi:rfaE bifunctional protein kinase chain/domain